MTMLMVAALLVGAVLALGTVLARRVVGSYGHGTIRIVAAGADSITFDVNRKSSHPGIFGLWFPGGHAVVGDIVRYGKRSVERALLKVNGDLGGVRRAVWEGDVFACPSELGAYEDVGITTPLGVAAAWQFRPQAPGSAWAIHIHGVRATRINAIRTVHTFQRLGFTSLVISYRGDGEGPHVEGNSMLGLTEWLDVDAAITYALEQGASSVVLVGWSMGASLALLASERSQNKQKISGLVLVSPATEWRATIKAGALRHGLPFPSGCAKLASLILSTPLLCRLAGLSAPINFEEIDWTRSNRLTVPTLVIHSDGDRTIPIAVTRRFVAANPGIVSFHESEAADHAWEYNIDPDAFDAAIKDWLAVTQDAKLSSKNPTS